MRREKRRDAARVGRGSHRRRANWILLAMGCLLLMAVPLAVAQSGDGPLFTLSWWTVDGGGGNSEGGGYRLASTAGQPDAGLLEGGGFALGGGFWRGGAVIPPGVHIYLPVIIRNR